VLEATLRASAEAGLPAIQVSANQGRLLQLLAQTQGARRILEVEHWAVIARSAGPRFAAGGLSDFT